MHKGDTYLFFYDSNDSTLYFAKAKNNTNANFVRVQVIVDNNLIRARSDSSNLLAACSLSNVV